MIYRFAAALLCVIPSGLVFAVSTSTNTVGDESASSSRSEMMNNLLVEYCQVCHNDEALTGGLTLETFDAAELERSTEVAEKIIRKLRAGMMPPSYAPQPEPVNVGTMLSTLENRIDGIASKKPNPGRRTFQRLNRAEYVRSVRDLLALDVDVDALLPSDTISHSFDNIADVQTLSPTLMDGYFRAAEKISLEAVGDANAGPSGVTYKVPRRGSQLRHVLGAPFGTRGGISIIHNFVADGEYVFKVQLHGSPQGYLYGRNFADDEQIEVSIDGNRIELLDIDPLIAESDPLGLNIETQPFVVTAGPHRVSAAFLRRFEGPNDDLIGPNEHTLADSHIGITYGITTLPHLRDFTIRGPKKVMGVSETPSRKKIFKCRPTSPDDEISCAGEIVKDLASQAYRRPVGNLDLEDLMSFYESGRAKENFESGIRLALQAILASPRFVFRTEEMPSEAVDEQNYNISSFELVSRLSFFLWATSPDDELMNLALEGRLSDSKILEKQVLRMLADPRAESLATRFAYQWLRLQDLEKIHPDAVAYPQFDTTLADAMQRETELLFYNLIKEDRSVLELLTADYTFVNDRLAKHYGIPEVTGSRFRRVALTGVNANRTGVLGQGSILTLTSVANRTSPVQRGKWVLEVLLGSPPPPPPPDIPDLEETRSVSEERLLTLRERMEEHRSNPACKSCHLVIDPIGMALENFDVTGAWRMKDEGMPIDVSGELYEGTTINGPLELRDAILKRPQVFLTAFTESLMTYALGRRVEYYDMPTVRTILRDASQNDYRMFTFVMGVVNSPAFRMARIDETVSTAVGPGS